MAVSVDTVYQRVLVLANKEQRGYITPQEFNLLANQAQMEIFEQYFYDINQFNKVPGNTQEYSDMLTLLYEKIGIFETTQDSAWMTSNMPITKGAIPTGVGVLENGFNIPRDEIYRVGEIFVSRSSCEMLNPKDFRLALLSPLTSPTINRPIATIENNSITVAVRGNEIPWPPPPLNELQFITPINTNSTLGISYVRRPANVQWAYVVINDKPLYNDNVSSDFQLHSAEQTELVYKILKLSGMTLKDLDMIKMGGGLESTETQNQKK